MGFDFNPINSKPIIRETASVNDGGAGNLGYFQQERSKDGSIFKIQDDNAEDTFEKDGIEEVESFSLSKLIAKIIFSIREFIRKLLKKK